PNGTDIYACRPVQDGPSAPIRIIENKTMLTAELTRSFNVGSCNEDAVRCSGQTLQMCIDGVWENIQICSGATPICDAEKESCLGQNSNLVTMNDWFQANKIGYSNTKASPAFADGSLVTVTGAFYISNYIIDGVTAVLNAKNTYSTSIVISNLSGINSISFDYKTWGSDSATLNITDGTNQTTLTVKSSDTTVKTFNYAFNNDKAKTVTITPESKGSAGRVLIDNISWTSPN
ncbi:MAG: hypothetical protein IJ268_00225, partial [Proteobacteria bacterium]|nr:hypothetical protein [Pseudomonadota bacterium]